MEMLQMLEEERTKEYEREQELERVHNADLKGHLENTFRMERGIASAKIARLSE